jgi:hypothetical protein
MSFELDTATREEMTMQTWRMLSLGVLVLVGLATMTLWLLGLWPRTAIASVLVPVTFSPLLSIGSATRAPQNWTATDTRE